MSYGIEWNVNAPSILIYILTMLSTAKQRLGREAETRQSAAEQPLAPPPSPFDQPRAFGSSHDGSLDPETMQSTS